MKYLSFLFLLFCLTSKAQQKIKVKKEDNRFFFFQTGVKNDTVIKHKTDLFRIHFPDSAQQQFVIHIQNAQFIKTKNDSLFRLAYIPGMKYSLSKPDTAYIPLLEGICESSKNIVIVIKNIKTHKTILQNNFIVK
ncbi:MAG: hypothetical protein V4506_13205 [Bacteroidota bacterium]